MLFLGWLKHLYTIVRKCSWHGKTKRQIFRWLVEHKEGYKPSNIWLYQHHQPCFTWKSNHRSYPLVNYQGHHYPQRSSSYHNNLNTLSLFTPLTKLLRSLYFFHSLESSQFLSKFNAQLVQTRLMLGFWPIYLNQLNIFQKT